jgi:hypothetical protein
MILLIAALLAADPAAAAAPPPVSSQTVTVTGHRSARFNDPVRDDTLIQKDASDDTVLCHKNYATGSRLNITKVCMTKRHWLQIQNEQAGYLDQMTAMKH